MIQKEAFKNRRAYKLAVLTFSLLVSETELYSDESGVTRRSATSISPASIELGSLPPAHADALPRACARALWPDHARCSNANYRLTAATLMSEQPRSPLYKLAWPDEEQSLSHRADESIQAELHKLLVLDCKKVLKKPGGSLERIHEDMKQQAEIPADRKRCRLHVAVVYREK